MIKEELKIKQTALGGLTAFIHANKCNCYKSDTIAFIVQEKFDVQLKLITQASSVLI